jgi:hypothetical protein
MPVEFDNGFLPEAAMCRFWRHTSDGSHCGSTKRKDRINDLEGMHSILIVVHTSHSCMSFL